MDKSIASIVREIKSDVLSLHQKDAEMRRSMVITYGILTTLRTLGVISLKHTEEVRSIFNVYLNSIDRARRGLL